MRFAIKIKSFLVPEKVTPFGNRQIAVYTYK